jgi:hypothetical protein
MGLSADNASLAHSARNHRRGISRHSPTAGWLLLVLRNRPRRHSGADILFVATTDNAGVLVGITSVSTMAAMLVLLIIIGAAAMQARFSRRPF